MCPCPLFCQKGKTPEKWLYAFPRNDSTVKAKGT